MDGSGVRGDEESTEVGDQQTEAGSEVEGGGVGIGESVAKARGEGRVTTSNPFEYSNHSYTTLSWYEMPELRVATSYGNRVYLEVGNGVQIHASREMLRELGKFLIEL